MIRFSNGCLFSLWQFDTISSLYNLGTLSPIFYKKNVKDPEKDPNRRLYAEMSDIMRM